MSKELGLGKVDAGSWSAALNFLASEMTALRKRQAEPSGCAKTSGQSSAP